MLRVEVLCRPTALSRVRLYRPFQQATHSSRSLSRRSCIFCLWPLAWRSWISRAMAFSSLGRVDKRDSLDLRPVIQALRHVGEELGAQLISDDEWVFFEGFIRAVRHPNGRQASNHRLVLDGIFWIARTGARWRDLPEEFDKWSSVYRQFRRWTLAGLWEDILDSLNHAGIAPDKLQMVDSTVIRAHHHAAGAKGGLRKRLLAVQELGSRPRSSSASTALAYRCEPRSRRGRIPTIPATIW